MQLVKIAGCEGGSAAADESAYQGAARCLRVRASLLRAIAKNS